MTRETKGNGTYTAYQYDAADRLLSVANHAADDSLLSSFEYAYDLTGLPETMTTLDGRWTYEHDELGQLTRAVFESANPAIPDQDLVYQYDAGGNRELVVANGESVSYVTNSLNQYVTVGATEYEFDADGIAVRLRPG